VTPSKVHPIGAWGEYLLQLAGSGLAHTASGG
jgi:hypothetical protein